MKNKNSRLFNEEEDEWMEDSGINGRSQSRYDEPNGYSVREIDISQIPKHLIQSLTQILPDGSNNAMLSVDEMQADDGAWILQCPKQLELSTLLQGKKISLNGNPTILEDEDQGRIANKTQKFESVAVSREDPNESVILLLPSADSSFKMVSVPLNGYITVRHHLDDLEVPEVSIAKKKRHKLPSGIKERHPIYGVDFKHALSSKKVTQSPKKYEDLKQDKLHESPLKLNFSKRRQSKLEEKLQDCTNSNKSFVVAEQIILTNSKRKSKQALNQESISELSEDSIISKKSKKKKKQSLNNGFIESFMESPPEPKFPSFSSPKKGYKQKPQTPQWEETVTVESPKKSKKSNKRKREDEEIQAEEEVQDDTPVKKHKKVKRTKIKEEPMDEEDNYNCYSEPSNTINTNTFHLKKNFKKSKSRERELVLC